MKKPDEPAASIPAIARTPKIDLFMAVWFVVLPISSIVLIPSVKGTTPAYLLSFLAILVGLALCPRKSGRYAVALTYALGIFALLNAAAQLGLSLARPVSFADLRMVDPYDDTMLLRTTLFTQGLYMLASLSAFVFISTFYRRERHERYAFAGITLLACYGLYEFAYYLAFQQSGDFLTNRVFGHGGEISTGSAFQRIQLGGITVERLKSLTGEPSMYAFTTLPFFVYAVHTKRRVASWLLLSTLILSTSTTAVLGLLVYFIGRVKYLGIRDRLTWMGLVLVAAAAAIGGKVAMDFYSKMILAKVTLASFSGLDRFSSFASHMRFFADAPWSVKLFGLGFGYVRSTDMFTTILVNNGLVGFLVFTALFAYPILRLRTQDYRTIGLKLALVVIYVTAMVSVSEYAYLSIWLFLGIAYSEIRVEKQSGRRVCDEGTGMASSG